MPLSLESMLIKNFLNSRTQNILYFVVCVYIQRHPNNLTKPVEAIKRDPLINNDVTVWVLMVLSRVILTEDSFGGKE